VLLIDPSYSEMIQDPAKAAILLIPKKRKQNDDKKRVKQQQRNRLSLDCSNVWFMMLTHEPSCRVVALIHALANLPSTQVHSRQ